MLINHTIDHWKCHSNQLKIISEFEQHWNQLHVLQKGKREETKHLKDNKEPINRENLHFNFGFDWKSKEIIGIPLNELNK